MWFERDGIDADEIGQDAGDGREEGDWEQEGKDFASREKGESVDQGEKQSKESGSSHPQKLDGGNREALNLVVGWMQTQTVQYVHMLPRLPCEAT